MLYEHTGQKDEFLHCDNSSKSALLGKVLLDRLGRKSQTKTSPGSTTDCVIVLKKN